MLDVLGGTYALIRPFQVIVIDVCIEHDHLERHHQGWDAQISWDEFKFQLKHRKDFKRVAVVGEARWDKWASMVSRIFTGSDVRYCDQDQAEEASSGIESGW